VFDDCIEVCDGSGVRRLGAFIAIMIFTAALAAPALALCHGKQACCCDPADNSVCAPDCCGSVKTTLPVDVSSWLRATLTIAVPLASSCLPLHHAIDLAPQPAPQLLVALHERAGPPVPLRI
jgi:hypothetical protein